MIFFLKMGEMGVKCLQRDANNLLKRERDTKRDSGNYLQEKSLGRGEREVLRPDLKSRLGRDKST